MIRKAEQTKIRDLFTINNIVTYSIPQYQREYTWTKEHWETLFNDIYENESHYFLGSIMSVAADTSPTSQEYEVIDGQQRMTTISLLFAAVVKKLIVKDISLSEDQEDELRDLKKRLIYKNKIRLVPQIQGNNRDDYNAVLNEIGICTSHKQPYAGNRKMFKAYNFFLDELGDVLSERSSEDSATVLFEILQKVLDAIIVNIIVDNYSDAFMMFESLNNRGEPLSAIDLIKNTLLAQLGKSQDMSIDTYYQQWIRFMKYLGDDYNVQERFFRQYYNAFTDRYVNIVHDKKATRSNLIDIYGKIINNDANSFIKTMLDAGRIYSHLICNQDQDDQDYVKLRKSLLDLSHIQGAPSYELLLYLLIEQKKLSLDEEHLVSIINGLVKFFVRRNITNYPATYELPSLFKGIIQGMDKKIGVEIIDIIVKTLISRSLPDDKLSEKLRGPMYQDNVGATRFILCYIEERNMTKETFQDLWKQEGKKYLWTIEHIFPEGENPPKHWVDMIAEGDIGKAKELLDSHAHKLGNLSITAFNSQLSARSFIDKRDLKDKENKNQYIGYRNGIKLNEDLIVKDSWTKEDIDERTDKIVNIAMNLFKYE
jgi:uncharacterized protein with ParB-like and HNH nuclease domain